MLGFAVGASELDGEAETAKTVEKLHNSNRVTPKYQRRALAESEVQALLAVAGPRRIVYPTGVMTGIRRGELAAN